MPTSSDSSWTVAAHAVSGEVMSSFGTAPVGRSLRVLNGYQLAVLLAGDDHLAGVQNFAYTLSHVVGKQEAQIQEELAQTDAVASLVKQVITNLVTALTPSAPALVAKEAICSICPRVHFCGFGLVGCGAGAGAVRCSAVTGRGRGMARLDPSITVVDRRVRRWSSRRS